VGQIWYVANFRPTVCGSVANAPQPNAFNLGSRCSPGFCENGYTFFPLSGPCSSLGFREKLSESEFTTTGRYSPAVSDGTLVFAHHASCAAYGTVTSLHPWNPERGGNVNVRIKRVVRPLGGLGREPPYQKTIVPDHAQTFPSQISYALRRKLTYRVSRVFWTLIS